MQDMCGTRGVRTADFTCSVVVSATVKKSQKGAILIFQYCSKEIQHFRKKARYSTCNEKLKIESPKRRVLSRRNLPPVVTQL